MLVPEGATEGATPAANPEEQHTETPPTEGATPPGTTGDNPESNTPPDASETQGEGTTDEPPGGEDPAKKAEEESPLQKALKAERADARALRKKVGELETARTADAETISQLQQRVKFFEHRDLRAEAVRLAMGQKSEGDFPLFKIPEQSENAFNLLVNKLNPDDADYKQQVDSIAQAFRQPSRLSPKLIAGKGPIRGDDDTRRVDTSHDGIPMFKNPYHD